MGYAAVFALIGNQVIEPFVEKSGHLVVVRSSARKSLCITRPAQALIALGAIGRYIQEIALLTPVDVALQLIEQRVGTSKFPGFLHVAVDHHGGEVVGVQNARIVGDFDVAKAHEGKMRFKSLFSHALEGVIQFTFCVAQVGGIKIAFFVQYFSVLDVHRRSGRASDFETDPSGNVLPKIDDFVSLRGGNDFLRFDFLNPPHGWPLRCNKVIFGKIGYVDRPPALVVKTRFGPIGNFHPGIVSFPIVQIGHANGTVVLGFPRSVGTNDLLRTIAEGNDQLGQQAQLFSIHIAVVFPGQVAAVPAVAEYCTYDIGTWSEQIAYIVHEILQVILIGRPTGRKQILTYFFSIDDHEIETMTGGIEAR